MCILFIAVNQHPKFPLIIAANRDEFHQRPTLTSHFWPSHTDVLAGKDLSAGGTWMGINQNGRIAALTNIRAPGKERLNAITRGELVTNFLTTQTDVTDYLNTLQNTHLKYNGYNLLFGELNQLHVYNSFENKAYKLDDGVYGLSNASLNSPWPKIDAGRDALANYCQHANILSREHLFELLKSQQAAHDDELPNTGIPIEWERKLSSIFIQSADYGTRSSTVLLIDNNNHCFWEERTFNSNAEMTDTKVFEFDLT
ncbi:MAG: NRDE family protein [Glaciecola sp.]